MKKIILFVMVALIGGIVGQAQTAGAVEQQMKQVRKQYKTEKLGKEEAKRKEKDSWCVMEGSLPMAQQFEQKYTREYMLDEDGEPIYFFGHGTYTSDDKNAAYKFACNDARHHIASQLETELAEAFSTDVRSSKLSSDESVTVTEAFAEGKSVVSAKLTGVRPIVKIYKRDKFQYTVEVEMYYSREKAKELARQAAREKLAEKDPGLTKLVDDMLNDKLKKK